MDTSIRPTLWQIPAPSLDADALQKHADELLRLLQRIVTLHRDVRFASSLAAEDMIITDIIARASLPVRIFTLDTGRLHAESVDLIDQVEKHYAITIGRITPNADTVARFVDLHGLNGFYDSQEAKVLCCHVRKVEPLNRALTGADAWLTGQRREQSVTRETLAFEEIDSTRGIAKFNPLHDWADGTVWSYVQHFGIPIHPLHRRGYPSIGCEPCTRAIRPDEDIRAGRWWWLRNDSKECGLHVSES